MPEGPSIVILKEAVQPFKGQVVMAASTYAKNFDVERLVGKPIVDFKSWGKHFLICFPDLTVRIHLMMFGSYRINERKVTSAKLHLQFDDGELNFYSCVAEIIDAPLDEVYEWSADIMNPAFDHKAALKKLKANPDIMVCDALLDQNIFSGSGNIVKNEVLYRTRIQPASLCGRIPPAKLKEMIAETVNYSFEFLRWKKEFTLKKHWEAHTKKTCPRDDVPFKKEYLGKTKRRSFYCTVCQKLYV